MLPQISPSPLTSLKEPIGHPNWVYELKHDGFRGILYVDRDQAWLVSRKGNKFRQFDPLLKQVLRLPQGTARHSGWRGGIGRRRPLELPGPHEQSHKNEGSFDWLRRCRVVNARQLSCAAHIH